MAGLRAGTYFVEPYLNGFFYVPGDEPDAPAAPVVAVKAGQQIDGFRIALAP